MSRASYSELDNAILRKVGDRPCSFSDLWPELDPVAERASGRRGDGYRAMDRRLQALRKAGRIHYAKGLWRAGAKPA